MAPTYRWLAAALLVAAGIVAAVLLLPTPEPRAASPEAARLERIEGELVALRRLVEVRAARDEEATALARPPERDAAGVRPGAVLERLERVEAELRLLSERLADSRSPAPSLSATLAANPLPYERSLEAALAEQLARDELGPPSPLMFLTRDEVLVRFGRPSEVDESAWVYRWGWYEDEEGQRVHRYEMAFHFDGAYVAKVWANDWGL